ncbi:hypothetical protein PEC302110_24780 [Pectobacterium araliae]|uniref:Uncharacterized protein n=1 Tax=Pectobacterium araliae TaxID=3073862 RepID=A0AAN0MLL0_9GAMM|nr:hypothetical protein PEC302110_24780 [Pectobacterium sp. MAFF 302110]
MEVLVFWLVPDLEELTEFPVSGRSALVEGEDAAGEDGDDVTPELLLPEDEPLLRG